MEIALRSQSYSERPMSLEFTTGWEKKHLGDSD